MDHREGPRSQEFQCSTRRPSRHRLPPAPELQPPASHLGQEVTLSTQTAKPPSPTPPPTRLDLGPRGPGSLDRTVAPPPFDHGRDGPRRGRGRGEEKFAEGGRRRHRAKRREGGRGGRYGGAEASQGPVGRRGRVHGTGVTWRDRTPLTGGRAPGGRGRRRERGSPDGHRERTRVGGGPKGRIRLRPSPLTTPRSEGAARREPSRRPATRSKGGRGGEETERAETGALEIDGESLEGERGARRDDSVQRRIGGKEGSMEGAWRLPESRSRGPMKLSVVPGPLFPCTRGPLIRVSGDFFHLPIYR